MSVTDWPEADPADIEFVEKHGFRAFIKKLLNEEAAYYKAELEAGVDAEHEEEIRAWFALQEAQRRFEVASLKREAREEGNSVLRDLPRPGLLN